jgi:mannose-6-phosphate isomerase-like protein (cupin superfamily)
MNTQWLQAKPDYFAPDGSEIRQLLGLEKGRGNMAHCVLRPDQVSVAQRHKSVGEIWYCLQGLGQVWRKPPQRKPTTVDVGPGRCLTIEAGTHFQFRNTGAEPLTFIIATIPSWPGPEEAVKVKGCWSDDS